MHKLHGLKDKLLKELKEYADKSAYTPNDVETIRNLISSINKICEYSDAEEEKEEYSGRMSHTYPLYTYDGENAYARGRMRARRDSMGRYSREYGYSRNDEMIDKLYAVMEEAPEDKKMELKRMIEKFEKM